MLVFGDERDAVRGTIQMTMVSNAAFNRAVLTGLVDDLIRPSSTNLESAISLVATAKEEIARGTGYGTAYNDAINAAMVSAGHATFPGGVGADDVTAGLASLRTAHGLGDELLIAQNPRAAAAITSLAHDVLDSASTSFQSALDDARDAAAGLVHSLTT